MLIAARCSFFALRRFAAICRSLAIVSELPIAPNAMFPRHQMADIQRSSKLALLSLRPWRLALVTQLLALQAPPEAKSASVCAVDGRFSANIGSSPITNNVASAQAVRLTAPPRTSSRKAFRTRGRSTMSVVHLSLEILKSVFRSSRTRIF
jgi:hypothetical protein